MWTTAKSYAFFFFAGAATGASATATSLVATGAEGAGALGAAPGEVLRFRSAPWRSQGGTLGG
ncbi:MAG: hypothetical protein WCH46_02760 [bacterium]